MPQISIHSAPVDVSGYLRMRLFGADTSVIVTSATLSVCADGRKSFNQGLNYIVRRLGAQDSEQLQVGSPFDYNSQMKLYVAKQMPEPQDKLYEQELIKYIQKFVKMTHGKAFVLFTNNQLMKSTADEMDDFFRQTLLYDFYGELLTSHQKEIYEQFVLEDLSLSEIAAAAGISRQGVHDLVKRCSHTLQGYEDKLHLVEKFLAIREKVKEIDRELDRQETRENREMIEGIRRISRDILEEL